MANDFRSAVGGYRRQAFQNAMQSLSGGSATTDAIGRSSSSQHHLDAIGKAAAWQQRSADLAAGMMERQGAMAANAMGDGLDLTATAAANAAEVKAAKSAQRAQSGASTLGLIGQGIGLVAGIFCERRLKRAITPISAEQAWAAARDIPIYSFAYKLHPTTTCYGPMADEAERVDPSLVRPSLIGPDEEGPIRGFDVLRYQAMQAVALQQALRRIEHLEAMLDRPAWPVNVAAAPADPTVPWPVEVADAS